MPEFIVTRKIESDAETVWAVLNDFGNIHQWNPGVKHSAQTSDGVVGAGTMRHCDLIPFGSVDERIVIYDSGRRMTIDIFEATKLPISRAEADFQLKEEADGTLLTLRYKYELNLLGRILKSYTDKQLRKGLGGLTKSLAGACEKQAG